MPRGLRQLRGSGNNNKKNAKYYYRLFNLIRYKLRGFRDEPFPFFSSFDFSFFSLSFLYTHLALLQEQKKKNNH